MGFFEEHIYSCLLILLQEVAVVDFHDSDDFGFPYFSDVLFVFELSVFDLPFAL